MGVEDFNFLRKKQFEVRCLLFHPFLCVLQWSQFIVYYAKAFNDYLIYFLGVPA